MPALQASSEAPPERASKHYSLGALQYIVPPICTLITKQVCAHHSLRKPRHMHAPCAQDELEDEDEWTVSKAATICLTRIALACKDEVVQVCRSSRYAVLALSPVCASTWCPL
jgi:hypothetical protein